MHNLPFGVTQADLDVVRIHRQMMDEDGDSPAPRPIRCPLAALIKGNHYGGERPDAPDLARQKAATKRLKARRQAEWLGLFAAGKSA